MTAASYNSYIIYDLQNQNDFLTKKIGETQQRYKAYNKIADRNNKLYETLNFYNNILFWLYFIVFAILQYVFFLRPSSLFLVTRVIISIVFFLFPFVCSTLVHYFKSANHYFYALLFNRVFNGSVDRHLPPPNATS